MEKPKKQLVNRLRESNNVLITVSRNPSVDQLAAAIGLTLVVNALGKHGTAVFSGKVPSVLEFLQPDETIEKNTDSLRDFIISLDKAKADKLRYKVEDEMVKIFITPYKTYISDNDLVFSQGDFNVDMVVAIGVREKDELDEAITTHGRILHDATVVTVNTSTSGQLGSINWIDAEASSLCEMLAGVSQELKADVLDAQMATAFLTGIVAETERFSNEKTSSDTMKVSAALMAAGANQQLVATKLQQPEPEPESEPEPEQQTESEERAQEDDSRPEEQKENQEQDQQTQNTDGTLRVEHPADEDSETDQSSERDDKSDYPVFDETLPPLKGGAENTEDTGNAGDQSGQDAKQQKTRGSQFMTDAPSRSGTLTANGLPDKGSEPYDPLKQPSEQSLLNRDEVRDEGSQEEDSKQQTAERSESQDNSNPPADEKDQPDPAEAPELPIPDTQTLTDLEQAVDSPHISKDDKQEKNVTNSVGDTPPDTEDARRAVEQAMSSNPNSPLKPVESLNASGHMDVNHDDKGNQDAQQNNGIHIDPSTGEIQFHPIASEVPKQNNSGIGDLDKKQQNTPPPVPPPMMPPLPPSEPNQNGNGPTLPPVNY